MANGVKSLQTHYINVSKIWFGYNCYINIDAPDFFHRLLSVSLSGWKALENCILIDHFCIKINRDFDGKFEIVSDLQYNPTPRSDLIDTLNEIFLTISYLLWAKNPEASLIHCGAYKFDGKNNILLGSKKSGKSSFVQSQAKNNAVVLADDLILWLPWRAKFISIGLPLRMRRPIPVELFIEKKNYLSGKNIAYLNNKTFRTVGVGYEFIVDRISYLNNRKEIEIPFYKWAYMLSKFKIDEKYRQIR